MELDTDKVYRVRDYDTSEPAMYVYFDDLDGWVYINSWRDKAEIIGDNVTPEFVIAHVEWSKYV